MELVVLGVREPSMLLLFIDWASGRIDSIGVNNHICPHSIIDETFNEARQLSRLDIASARG